MSIWYRWMAAALLLAATTGARAQANDDWAGRTPIQALPFEVVTPMSAATNDASDPVPSCQGTGQSSYGTIWFGYTTGGSPEILTLRVADFQVATVLAVYTGSPGAFRLAPGACARAGGSPYNAQLAGVRLAANTTYSILLSAQSPISGLSVDFTMAAAVLYNVTKVEDTFDGTCDSDCSLREAIQAANVTAGAVIVPAGTYVLSLAGNLEYANATGDLDILNDMAIYGAGMGQTIVDANGIDRVINVVSSAQDATTLILGDLTLTHGDASAMQSPNGGGILVQSLSPGFIGLERVALVDNHALQTGGGLYTESAGTVSESRFTLNSVAAGAGGGGGGAQIGNQQQGPFVISASTFDGNDGGDTGGGIQSNGNLQLTDSTISGNGVAQYGGGVHVFNGPFQMSSTTVAFNKAGIDPFQNLGGGLFLQSGSNYQLSNNIIAGNTVDDCLIYTFAGGVIVSHHNHVQAPGQDATGCTFTGTGDVVGSDPQLAPLADNGGPTPTHALPFTSPAHDTGDPAGCNAPDGLPLAYDQRGAGFPRLDGVCDKGAFEQPVLFANGFEQ